MIIVVPHGRSNKHALNAKVNDIAIIAKTLYLGGCWTKSYPVVNNVAWEEACNPFNGHFSLL